MPSDEPSYTITGFDSTTGERVSYAMTAAEVEQFIVLAEGLPDPNDVSDDDDD